MWVDRQSVRPERLRVDRSPEKRPEGAEEEAGEKREEGLEAERRRRRRKKGKKEGDKQRAGRVAASCKAWPGALCEACVA